VKAVVAVQVASALTLWRFRFQAIRYSPDSHLRRMLELRAVVRVASRERMSYRPKTPVRFDVLSDVLRDTSEKALKRMANT